MPPQRQQHHQEATPCWHPPPPTVHCLVRLAHPRRHETRPFTPTPPTLFPLPPLPLPIHLLHIRAVASSSLHPPNPSQHLYRNERPQQQNLTGSQKTSAHSRRHRRHCHIPLPIHST